MYKKVMPSCVQTRPEVSQWIGKTLRTKKPLYISDRGKWMRGRNNPLQHATVIPPGKEVVVDHISWKVDSGRYHLMTLSTPLDTLGDRPTDISCLWSSDGTLRGNLVEVVRTRGGKTRREVVAGKCQCPVCLGIVSIWTILLVGFGVLVLSGKWWPPLLAITITLGISWWVTRNPFRLLDIDEDPVAGW